MVLEVESWDFHNANKLFCLIHAFIFHFLNQVHQHQDRGETFQCQLCPFTSSRHFSLKLHMRCHQHFLRTESKVKEEVPETEVKGSPQLNTDSCTGPQKEGGGPDPMGSASVSKTPDVAGQPSGGIPPLLVKEEPKDDNGVSAAPFALSTVDRPPNNTQPKDYSDFVANTASALFSQDISVKMASDFLMKLSGNWAASGSISCSVMGNTLPWVC